MTLKPLAYIDLAVPWQPNPGGMRRWHNGLRHWLIAGFRYAAQAAAMREGHLWDITPRVAPGEHGGEWPFAAFRLDGTTDQESLGPRRDGAQIMALTYRRLPAATNSHAVLMLR